MIPSLEENAANKALVRTQTTLRFICAAQLQRVCRAWHSTSQVKVLIPGVRKAEG